MAATAVNFTHPVQQSRQKLGVGRHSDTDTCRHDTYLSLIFSSTIYSIGAASPSSPSLHPPAPPQKKEEKKKKERKKKSHRKEDRDKDAGWPENLENVQLFQSVCTLNLGCSINICTKEVRFMLRNGTGTKTQTSPKT